MSLTVEVDISIGRYECIIKRCLAFDDEIYQVDVQQKVSYTPLKILYAGTCWLQYDPKHDTFIERKHEKAPPTADHWLELQSVIIPHIMTNR